MFARLASAGARCALGSAVVVAGLALASPAQATTATSGASGTVITMFSDPGDYVGQGSSQEFDSSNSTISGTLTTSGISLSASGGTSGTSPWSFVIDPAPGATIGTGYYSGAQRAEFRSAGHPGIDIFGDGRGCNADTGSFEVRDLLATGGTIDRLDLLYEQHCEGAPPALFGEIRVGEPQTSGAVVSSGSITWPALGLGASGTTVPVYVRNLGGTDVAVGTAGVVDDAAEFPIRSDGCSGQTLSPGQSCDLWIGFAPTATHGPRAGRLQLPLGAAIDTVQVDGLVTAGTTSLSMQSQPGDWVGYGADYDFSAANATFSFSGGPSGVEANVNSGGELWTVDMFPAAGSILAPGYYGSATRYPFNGSGNGLSVFGDGRGCDADTGSFTVNQAVFSPVDNSLQHFSASFTQYCDGSPSALTGTLTYNYAPVVTPPPAVSDLAAHWSGPNVSVSWVNPVSASYAYTVVRIEEADPVGESPVAGVAVYGGTGTSATASGLSEGTAYTATAFTVDQYGNVSNPDNVTVSVPYTPLVPVRLFDTRNGTGGVAKSPLAAGGTVKVRVAGVDGVPPGAKAAALNLTAVGATAPTYVTAWPDGTTRPSTSNLNPANANPIANFDIVSIGADGYVDFYNLAGNVNLLADLAGYDVGT